MPVIGVALGLPVAQPARTLRFMLQTRSTEPFKAPDVMPDSIKINRCLVAPEHGPRVLFFSGGSAFNGLSQHITAYTHNSIHLITPFDSGGSSAALRQAFDMPGVGDLRQRLLALADQSAPNQRELCQLLQYRLPANKTHDALHRELREITSGQHELMCAIPSEVRRDITHQLETLCKQLPNNFDLRLASLGNLVLAGGYLASGKDMNASLKLFSALINIRGTVRAIVDDSLHLGVHLDNGHTFIGQHLLTGKEHPDISSPVSSIFLSQSPREPNPVTALVNRENSQLIAEANIICYAPGSFYSSLIANLLPDGVADAVGKAPCPKVFIPNLGVDPEQLGMDFSATVQALIRQLRQCSGDKPVSDLLNYVVIDSDRSRYPYELDLELLDSLGIELLELPLVTSQSAPYYDDERLAQVLLSLA
ncbi:MAG: GAK system CofD-like protein [Halieaceae bacterium]|nr:GAK system CofD-like protein [Halieaceae bacterium]